MLINPGEYRDMEHSDICLLWGLPWSAGYACMQACVCFCACACTCVCLVFVCVCLSRRLHTCTDWVGWLSGLAWSSVDPPPGQFSVRPCQGQLSASRWVGVGGGCQWGVEHGGGGCFSSMASGVSAHGVQQRLQTSHSRLESTPEWRQSGKPAVIYRLILKMQRETLWITWQSNFQRLGVWKGKPGR